MRRHSTFLLSVTALVALFAVAGSLLGASSLQAMTAEELVAKHREARGGDGWEAIKSMTLEGNFAAFSKVHPFVMHRTQDGKFYVDHMLGDKQVVMGYDGDFPWWVHGWFGTWATRVTDLDRSVFMQDVDFPNVFFHLDDGFKLEYKGEGEVDGMPALVLELVRPDEWKETWYFDPDTFLELGRETTGSDFGRPSEQLTIYDDFREVEGVMIPFYTESQWYTRNRVFEVQSFKVNEAVDHALFKMPGPSGMDSFHQLAGDWQVKVESRQQPQAPMTESERTATVTPRLRGALWELSYASEDGSEVVHQLTYDRFNEAHQLVRIDDTTTYLDVQTGALEDGKLVVSNLETASFFETFGFKIKERNTISEISADGFVMETENSMDDGENWFTSSKMTFSR